MAYKIHPLDLQPVTVVTLAAFTCTTVMESSYQMLLLLYGLRHADAKGSFSLEGAASRLERFFQLRVEAGLSPEKQPKTKAENFTATRLRRTLIDQPYTIFEKYFLLSYDEQAGRLSFPEPLWTYLTDPNHKAEMTQIRALALGRLVEHFYGPRPAQSDKLAVADWVASSIEQGAK